MKIHVFPKVYPLDLYGNTHILQGGTLRICMKILYFQGGVLCICTAWKYAYFTKGCLQDLHEHTRISEGVSFGFVWKYKYFTRGTLRICMNKKNIFPNGYPLDLYTNTCILQRCTLRISLKIRVFPKGHPLDLYENTNVVQGSTLRIWMEIRIFPKAHRKDSQGNARIHEGVSLGFVWK